MAKKVDQVKAAPGNEKLMLHVPHIIFFAKKIRLPMHPNWPETHLSVAEQFLQGNEVAFNTIYPSFAPSLLGTQLLSAVYTSR